MYSHRHRSRRGCRDSGGRPQKNKLSADGDLTLGPSCSCPPRSEGAHRHHASASAYLTQHYPPSSSSPSSSSSPPLMTSTTEEESSKSSSLMMTEQSTSSMMTTTTMMMMMMSGDEDFSSKRRWNGDGETAGCGGDDDDGDGDGDYYDDEGDDEDSRLERHHRQHRGGGGSGGCRQMLACAMQAGFMVMVLMSCMGVNWARPSPSLPQGAASRLSEHEKHYRELQSKAVKYLAQFGYLTGPSRETGNLMSADDLTRAIKELQSMGGIPPTGVIDRRTEELMSKPRCGNVDTLMGVIPGQGRSDLGQNTWPVGQQGGRRGRVHGRRRLRRYVEAPSKWQKKNLTFRFLNYTPDIPLESVREIIHNAFALWSNATQLLFTEVQKGNADIMIQFASRYHQDGYPFDGKGMILAHAFFPGAGKGGDTHFDDDEFWTTNSTDGVDLFMVAAHEFGHALGLAHSAEPGALMYPWYQGFSGNIQLPRDDAQGIQKLYGPPQGDRPFSHIPMLEGSDDVDNSGYDYDSDRGSDDQPPDPCTTPFDAVTIIRSNMYLFIGKWFWRVDSRGVIKDPVHIHKFWYHLPVEIKKIDAVVERQGDKRILFFAGDRYWVFNANSLVTGFPKEGLPITEFGIPPDVTHIDTVFTWGFNKRTYLVAGDMYWKLNENNSLVEYDYPRDMSIWRGVPVPLDAAFQYWDGKTYFFKGRRFWKFYDLRMRIDREYPKLTADEWLECSEAHTKKNRSVLYRKGDKNSNIIKPASSASQYSAAVTTQSLLVIVLVLCVGFTGQE